MKYAPYIFFLIFCIACKSDKKKDKSAVGFLRKVRIMTLNPGHFHAALVQKTMYGQVDSTIYVFAPEGPEVADFLDKIGQYNTRSELPTNWKVVTYLGSDYLDKMISEKPGNVMVVAGKNSKKIDYILAAVKAGLNVYADKPLVINPEGYKKLVEAFRIAEEKGVLIYDIMTERFEATTAMQKEFSMVSSIFGELLDGSPEEPSISKESVHHFFKQVSGKPLVRPAWFFDVNEEGAGIVDVTTHLVDLVQWGLFPEQIIDTADIKMLSARSWPTMLTKEQFTEVTGENDFPEYLGKDRQGENLAVYANGEMRYKIKGKHAKVSVVWNYRAPEGTGDTHYSIVRGTKSDLIIKQGTEEDYRPTLYLDFKGNTEALALELHNVLENSISKKYPGTSAVQVSSSLWKINIPDTFNIGHEAHFAQVTQNYLRYLEEGNLPPWEVPNMVAKYYTTMEAYKMAQREGKAIQD